MFNQTTSAQSREAESIEGGVYQNKRHDSSHKHVSGNAVYIDDIPEPPGCLQIFIGMSTRPHARVSKLDVSKARSAEGVACILTAKDFDAIDFSDPLLGIDPIFADNLVEYVGQPIFAVAANTLFQARMAAKLVEVGYEELVPILSLDEAMEKGAYVLPPKIMERGDPAKALMRAKYRINGRLRIGGQEHFYLEGQVSLAVPSEDEEILVYCSTQDPTTVQRNVANVLGMADHVVTVEVRRLGGGFGGKEVQPTPLACIAAVIAAKTNYAAKLRLDRNDDMEMTGKRHDFIIDYDVGFNAEGRIEGIEFIHACRAGFSANVSGSVADRAMLHADNAYYLENVAIKSFCCKTNTVSNTAFRGFGSPQGTLGIEHVIDVVATHLAKDPLKVRLINFYGTRDRNITPYFMTVEDNVLHELVMELAESSAYEARRSEIREFNNTSPYVKRGTALTPVKFGVSFHVDFLNQAGALIHVYTDGSVQVNHGGTEMGQGLHTKIAQVVAEELQVDIDHVRVTSTNTGKVPNSSPTAASTGSDLNGMAAQSAARTIKNRLIEFAAHKFHVDVNEVELLPGRIRIGNEEVTFKEVVKQAYLARVSLSSTGFYATPKIYFDTKKMRGRPFYYFAYGAAVTEVEVDILTGEYHVMQTDILHDVGKSLNPVLDQGQVEGGYIQGVGWLTTEELIWHESGKLWTRAASTYKIPTCGDCAPVFNVKLWKSGKNKEEAIYRSKAVGEPPLTLGISALMALSDAVASVGDYKTHPSLNAPATPERVLVAIDRILKEENSCDNSIR
ncbi:MAG: xanthine dehydrogenase molybdopterin binding subunit [Aestuariibacter sp.]|nr:xanthine dehydrogenase molybdopterin binding subunit [Aestuariibacter sp.]